jgi:hypothetical protein
MGSSPVGSGVILRREIRFDQFLHDKFMTTALFLEPLPFGDEKSKRQMISLILQS